MTHLREFVDSWKSGQICLHPSDTVPGLSFNPRLTSAYKRLLVLKGREPSKPCISLVSSLEQALSNWQPLPDRAFKLISRFWPGPLSLVWKASKNAPRPLVSKDGNICLRFPIFTENSKWLLKSMIELDEILPTTSVNRSGEQCVRTWSEATKWASDLPEIFVPKQKILETPDTKSAEPSTVAVVLECGGISIVRKGSIYKEILAFQQVF